MSNEVMCTKIILVPFYTYERYLFEPSKYLLRNNLSNVRQLIKLKFI